MRRNLSTSYINEKKIELKNHSHQWVRAKAEFLLINDTINDCTPICTDFCVIKRNKLISLTVVWLTMNTSMAFQKQFKRIMNLIITDDWFTDRLNVVGRYNGET